MATSTTPSWAMGRVAPHRLARPPTPRSTCRLPPTRGASRTPRTATSRRWCGLMDLLSPEKRPSASALGTSITGSNTRTRCSVATPSASTGPPAIATATPTATWAPGATACTPWTTPRRCRRCRRQRLSAGASRTRTRGIYRTRRGRPSRARSPGPRLGRLALDTSSMGFSPTMRSGAGTPSASTVLPTTAAAAPRRWWGTGATVCSTWTTPLLEPSSSG
mmetsp:Transcript_20905/g.50605  ORF Transcript_20905/g.50605 Transcript_20905/m.50605 type:complete len:220 (+) Transcript_20905:1069-1728(+)